VRRESVDDVSDMTVSPNVEWARREGLASHWTVRAAAHSADWSIVVEDHRLTYRARARRRMQNGRG
jgi:hypothetical protein